MCGICGEFRFDDQAADRDLVSRMTSRLQARGPDDEGLYSFGTIALGHRRLAIIDLSPKSHQPFVDLATGLTIVFNGTIYNYPELRETLIAKGHQFTSSGDTEVILKAYAQWGTDCVSRLHGMFAFAIWNQRDESLFLARDRMGIKPLYFSHADHCIRFASNTQALMEADDLDTSIDSVGLHNLFMLHAVVPAPRTILRGIRKLAPGHCMLINRQGGVREWPYWELKARRPESHYDQKEWQELIHEALKRSVDRRLKIADVPVGVLLSGGLDSSLLVALLAEQGVTDLKTFTIGFEDQPEEKGSEFEFSDPVAERYGTEHHKFHVPNADVLKRLPEAVQAMSEPMFAQDAVAFYLLSEQVSKQIKVVQSGQGADEVFAGYFWYPQMNEAEGTPFERFRPYYFDRSHEEYLQMVDSKYAGGDYTAALIEEKLEAIEADTFIDRVLALDVTTLIVDDPVKRVDNMTMAWGLEARVPFLDHELVELAASMPPEYKLAEGGKGVLKAISRELLPAAVIDRPKGYFPMPALKYVRGEFLAFMQDILNSQKARERGLYQRSYVEKLLAEPDKHHTAIKGNKLWHLAALEFWLQQHGL
ncbi:MAG TPA: N-acetylglutaminylglutamine amidotransferase [Gammaproteobacteria bacterium]|nr:N-acetylglutaminylglutamine amidotransferase [Gammaproteobacteria bacterium]